MKIVKSKKYEREKEKLIKRGILSLGAIEKTEKIFENNPRDKRLRPHKIICKYDKKRFSLTIPNTQYRILYTDNGKIALFQRIINHDRYDMINKDC